jgi:hypothetical protein
MDYDEYMHKSDNQSMRKSRVGNRYFRIDPGYDKAVYENTLFNWVKIVAAFIVFYIVAILFWWACYSHGIRDADSAAWTYIGIFVATLIILTLLIIIGSFSNSKLVKADRLMLEVNELRKLALEDEEKKQKRDNAKQEIRRLENDARKDSDSDFNVVNRTRSDGEAEAFANSSYDNPDSEDNEDNEENEDSDDNEDSEDNEEFGYDQSQSYTPSSRSD